MPLKLANARIVIHGYYPELHLDVEGRPAVLDVYPKPTLHDAGIVFVGDDFVDVLPVVTLRVDRHERTARGCSDDPRLWRLYDRFLSMHDRKPGPFPIPD